VRNLLPVPLVLLLVAVAAAPAPAATRAPACAGAELRVAGGCASRAEARAEVDAIVREEMRDLGLKAAIVRVDTGRRPLLSRAFGRSMEGTPARRDMYFRIGSMAIPHLITVLLQLQDEGVLSLDDKLAKYRPGLPEANRITLRMLADNTSGYQDWIQNNPPFVDALLGAPFKQWTVSELLATAFARGPACDPGACFNYAHTNYAVLAQVIGVVTGRSVQSLIRERVFKPLGLRQTAISRRPAFPGPALHSYTAARDLYEDATFWSPSWTIGAGTVMSATIGDVARTARAVGSGALISPAASRERFAPSTVGLGPFTPDLYFGLGVIVAARWRLQNPMLNGYTGVMAYLPSRRLSVAIVTTALPRSARSETAFATQLFNRLTAYLSPGHQPTLPG
jgi:CubicO group peptidase (beta-lactamase class C family)